MDAISSDDIIRKLLVEKCEALEAKLDGAVLLIRSPMAPSIDDVVRREVENIAGSEGCPQTLVVVLETNGGSIEVVERLSDVFRHHFQTVKFVIPSFAYSAGTVLALSGDAIFMDYYSVLGPIDPQIRNRDGRWVPGLGYLEKYNDLVKKSADGSITHAELEFLVRKFDPAELFALEQAKAQSVDLIQKWLCAYKFKDWTHRETNGKKVTDAYKKKRAKDIALLLGDPNVWNSHGRGIPLRVLESDKIKLKIDNFGLDTDLNKVIREYYDLFLDFCGKLDVDVALHSKMRFLPLGGRR